MRIVGRTIVALAMTLAGACAHNATDDANGGQPDWISGNPANYPVEAYLLGRGRADAPAQARDRARADLAKIFEVEIEQVTRDVQAFRRLGDAEVDGNVGELDVERRLRTRTDQVLEGVEIVDQWQDPASGAVHALAAMPRAQIVDRLRRDIRRLDETTRRWVERARQGDNLLPRIEAASRAVALQRQRTALQRQLGAISRSATATGPEWPLDRLIADRDELRSRLRVGVDAVGGDRERLARTARRVVAEAGVTVADDAGYRLRVRLNAQTVGPRDGWYWRIGSLEVELVDAEGVTRGGWRWPLKVAASERSLLERRLYDDVGERLRDGLLRALVGIEGSDG